MGVLLQGFYKFPPNDAVPSPPDSKLGIPWWRDHIAAHDIDAWRKQFSDVADGSYIMRGIEMTFEGKMTDHLGRSRLGGDKTTPDLVLAPLQEPDKVQWDFAARSNQPMTAEEASAYRRVSAKLATESNGSPVQVTGPLKKNGSEFFLEVREFKV